MRVLSLLALCLLMGCSVDTPGGPIQMTVIQPVAGHCQYALAPVTVQTLSSVTDMTGKIGAVVVNSAPVDSSPTLLSQGAGFSAVNVQFGSSGGNYFPLDYGSLFAFSFYYAIETGYLMFANLDPTADLANLVPNLSGTLMVYDAQASSGVSNNPDIVDNAAFFSVPSNTGGQRNYIFSFPTQSNTDVPLGMNLGIMVHEFTHFEFNYLYELPRIAAGIKYSDGAASQNAVKALNEGLADYFGFLADNDPGYFLCSFPLQNRDMSVMKPYTSTIATTISSGQAFDPHAGGAVWASAQYAIGTAMGSHQQNGQSLIKLMETLYTCAGTTVSLPTAAQCHMNILGNMGNGGQSAASQVYSQWNLLGGGAAAPAPSAPVTSPGPMDPTDPGDGT